MIPDNFYFRHYENHETLYQAILVRRTNQCNVLWDATKHGGSGKAVYDIEMVEGFIKDKKWIIEEVKNNREALSFLKKPL